MFPKLDAESVAKLYSNDYSEISKDLHEDQSISYLSKFVELRNFLLVESTSKRKTYLDFGCGFNPVTLGIASSAGLEFQGVEFSSDVVVQANLIYPGKVLTVEDFEETENKYDYIFVGDVIEHLSEPIKILDMLKKRLSSNGVLIAQGPLQGGLTFTHILVNLKARLLSMRLSRFPPYHVTLATRKGMLEVFKASNFEVVHLKVSEPHWPAPSLSSILRRPSIRGALLFTSKMLDKGISKFLPNYGTYYFLVAEDYSA